MNWKRTGRILALAALVAGGVLLAPRTAHAQG
jgi:hypothetical protein